jgi:hypothetical protein
MSNPTIYKKMASAKNDFPAIKKDAKNPHFKNEYMSLDGIMDSIEPILYKHGLFVSHSINESILKTSVIDVETGESISTDYPIDCKLPDQKLGSSLTYGRRYSVCLLFAIVADEDDDGNAASKKETKPQEPPKALKPDMSKFINSVKIEHKNNPANLKTWCDEQMKAINKKFNSTWERHCKFTVDQLCRDAFKIEPFYNITSNPTDANGEPV